MKRDNHFVKASGDDIASVSAFEKRLAKEFYTKELRTIKEASSALEKNTDLNDSVIIVY